MIDALESRRMLASSVTGTSGNDVITMSVNGSNTIIDVNGSPVVNNSDTSFLIDAGGGNDTIYINEVRGSTSVTVRGALGNDTIQVAAGNFSRDVGGGVYAQEFQGEGDDQVIIADQDGVSGAHAALRTQHDRTYADGILGGNAAVYYDGFTEHKTINRSSANDTIWADSTAFGMVLNLGAGADTVRFGGSAHVIPALNPQTINGGAGSDTIYFDDSGGDAQNDRDYLVTTTSVMSQLLGGIENVELTSRDFKLFVQDTVTITGNGGGVNALTLRGQAIAFIGTEANPVDLDNLALTLVEEGSRPAHSYIYDQDVNLSGQPFQLYTVNGGTTQQVNKGSFHGTFSPYLETDGLHLNGGTTADRFEVGGIPTDYYVGCSGGMGDDSVYTTNANGHDNDLDEIFPTNAVWGPFSFAGGDGNDYMDLDDSSDQTDDGDEALILGQGLSKNAFSVDFTDSVERINLVADTDNNTITFQVAGSQRMTINGGGGNDQIQNAAQTLHTSPVSIYGDAVIVGGAGDDTLGANDSAPGFVSITQYEIDGTSLRFATNFSGFSEFTYDSTLEHLVLSQDDAASHTSLISKPTAMTLELSTGDGNDTVIIGGGDIDNSGFYASNTTILAGSGTDHIEFDDSDDNYSQAETEVFAFESFTTTKGPAGVTYGAFETQTLYAAGGGEGPFLLPGTVNLNAISNSIVHTSVLGATTRQCIVNVGNGTFGSLGGVLLITLGGRAADTLNFNDQAATGAKTYRLTETQLLLPFEATFSGIGDLNFYAGTGNDTVLVEGCAAATALFVNGGTGNDTVNLGNGAFAGFHHDVISVGGGGADNVRFVNTSEPAAVAATFTGTTFTANGGPQLYYSDFDTALMAFGGPSTTNIVSTSIPTTLIGSSGNDLVLYCNGDIDANIPTAGTLHVDGSGGIDNIGLFDTGDAPDPDQYAFDTVGVSRFRKTSGPIVATVTSVNVERRVLNASAGSTLITVSSIDGSVRVNAGGGDDVIRVNDATDTARVTVSSGSGNDQLFVNEDFGDFSDDPANVIIDLDEDLAGLSVLPGGKLLIGNHVTLSKTAGLFNVRGTVDVSGGAMLVSAGGVSAATLRTLLTRGHNGGAWNGTHSQGTINSSLAATSPLLDAVGHGLGSEIGLTTIGPFTINPTDTLIRHTLNGDANLDTMVDISDLGLLATNWQGSSKVWTHGDSDYSNSVDITDLGSLATNWQESISSSSALAAPRGGPAARSRRIVFDIPTLA